MVEARPFSRSYVPRICLYGPTGAGKSALCNALSGIEGFFKESENFTSCTSLPRQEKVRWFGKEQEKELFLVDTCGFGDSEGRDEEQMGQLVGTLKDFEYVNKFLIVLNSQIPRLDTQIQEMFQAFKTVFGEDIHKHFAIIFTRWGYDRKASRDRENKKITRESKTQEINEILKEKIGFDTNKFPIPCFFVDSSDFLELQKNDENMSDALVEEFAQIRDLCITSERFLCVPKGNYKTAATLLREAKEQQEREKEALQKLKQEKEEQENKKKQERERQEMIKKQAEEEYRRKLEDMKRRHDWSGWKHNSRSGTGLFGWFWECAYPYCKFHNTASYYSTIQKDDSYCSKQCLKCGAWDYQNKGYYC